MDRYTPVRRPTVTFGGKHSCGIHDHETGLVAEFYSRSSRDTVMQSFRERGEIVGRSLQWLHRMIDTDPKSGKAWEEETTQIDKPSVGKFSFLSDAT